MSDMFKPQHEPSRTFYKGIVNNARNRSLSEDWLGLEINHVWSMARDYAQQHGLPVPLIADIKKAEMMAAGHCDWAAKWAYGVADLLR